MFQKGQVLTLNAEGARYWNEWAEQRVARKGDKVTCLEDCECPFCELVATGYKDIWALASNHFVETEGE